MRNIKLSFIFLWLCFVVLAVAQPSNIGNPFIRSYSKKQYLAGTQNWDIVQNSAGVLFFANNSGMLQYDGKNWSCFPLPNKTIVRSLAVDSTGIIYVGGQNEFGFFVPDGQGNWTFKSLRKFLPEQIGDFEDVWNILIHEEGVFFLTNKRIFIYWNGHISLFKSKDLFNFMGLLEVRILIQDTGQGLSLFNGNDFDFIEESGQFIDGPLTGILPVAEGEWLVTTLYNGQYLFDGKKFKPWKPEGNDFLENNRVYSSAIFEDGRIALGTSLNGVLIYSKEYKLLQHLDREDGLLNNIVRHLFVDKDQHLWVGLDNGINYILASSPFTRFSPDGKARGAGYDVRIFENNIYFATANGLFRTPWKSHYSAFEKNRFRQVAGSKGQAWGLDAFDNDLLLSHHAGSFLISAAGAIKITRNGAFGSLKDRPTDRICYWQAPIRVFPCTIK